MQTLSQYIKAQPEKSFAAWAAVFGISRPYLHALVAGTRSPSLEVAARIATETRGAVPVTSWPRLRAVVAAADLERGAA